MIDNAAVQMFGRMTGKFLSMLLSIGQMTGVQRRNGLRWCVVSMSAAWGPKCYSSQL